MILLLNIGNSMKQNDFKKLFKLGFTLARQLKNMPYNEIENFILDLHAASIAINRLNLSALSIEDSDKKWQICGQIDARWIKILESVAAFNQRIAQVEFQRTRIAVFSCHLNLDSKSSPLRLFHPAWNEPFEIPFSQ